MLLVSSYKQQRERERERKEYWRLAGFPQLAQERVFTGTSDSPAIDCKELKLRVAEEGTENETINGGERKHFITSCWGFCFLHPLNSNLHPMNFWNSKIFLHFEIEFGKYTLNFEIYNKILWILESALVWYFYLLS